MQRSSRKTSNAFKSPSGINISQSIKRKKSGISLTKYKSRPSFEQLYPEDKVLREEREKDNPYMMVMPEESIIGKLN